MDFRSSGALGPENYYPLVAEGKILPYHSEIECFSHEAVQLKNGRVIPCDVVVLSTGYLTPTFPFPPGELSSHPRSRKRWSSTLSTSDPSTYPAAGIRGIQPWLYACSYG